MFSGGGLSIKVPRSMEKFLLLSRTPRMECSLVPGCNLEDKQDCEIKDVIVTVQVHGSCVLCRK